ncbi:MAG: hypothetical protein COA36_16760 [Desulfotalea sp.]|nr:MAG: hypothetical protein COA36_16760 [Desulfotalea sp.]
MRYKIYTWNYVECEISPTDEEVNNLDVFNTFSKAKEQYLKSLRLHRDSWNAEIKIGLKKNKKNTDDIFN